MQISVNDQSRDAPAGTTIAELLQSMSVESRHVAVEVNLQLVPRGQHARHALVDGDRLEIVTLVGGG
ncbi:MAG: sulfur carrier protein ThiS [Pirellulales bacterium]